MRHPTLDAGVRQFRMVPLHAISSRRILLDGQFRPAVLRIQAGRIASIEPFTPLSGNHTLDVGDLCILPGLVDTHVHINEPGRADWEGFHTGTAAAAAGGITTVVAMPLNCTPAATTADALRAEAAAAEGRCAVDYGFWGGVVPGNLDQLEPMVAAGAVGMKCFLVHSGVDDFPAIGERELGAAMRTLAALNVPLLAHAEDPGIVAAKAAALAAGRDPRDYLRYVDSRPVRAETVAIRTMIGLCRDTRCGVHIVHVTSRAGAELVAAAAREGLPFSGETCPHYLSFAAEEIGNGATLFKCAPPIRSRDERDALWNALRTGELSMVVSDHSPCPPAMKLPGEGDFARAWGGIASLELGLSAVWTGASARGIDLPTVARWMSDAPAAVAGVSNRKGKIAPGYDADVVVFDPDAEFTVDPARLHQRHKITPYAGRTLRGRVRTTVLRGRVVFESGSVNSERTGAWIRRPIDR